MTEENYGDFQNVIRRILMIEKTDEREIITDDERMKRKFMEKRRLLQKAKEKERAKSQDDKNSISIADMVSAVCAYGMGYNLTNIWDLTIY